VYLGTNLSVAVASAFLALQLIMIYQPPSEPVTIVSPLGEEWYVAQGGHAELINYHYITSAQRDALDIVQIVDSHTHPLGSSDLDSYYIFGAPLLAPDNGVVTSVVDGLADQPIGSVDNEHQAGNHLVIDISGGRYMMLADTSATATPRPPGYEEFGVSAGLGTARNARSGGFLFALFRVLDRFIASCRGMDARWEVVRCDLIGGPLWLPQDFPRPRRPLGRVGTPSAHRAGLSFRGCLLPRASTPNPRGDRMS
jgi:hypothetical protein